MLSHPNTNVPSFSDESHGEDGSFEVIPSMISVSNVVPKATPGNSGIPSKRTHYETKNSDFSGNCLETVSPPSKECLSSFKSLWFVISLLLLVVVTAATSPWFFGPSSMNNIEELRLEFKRDLESLRTEVEYDLKAHLLATAEVQTIAKQRTIDPEAQIKSRGHHNKVFVESETKDKQSPFHFVPSDLKYTLKNMLSDQMPSMDNLPSFDWNRDAIVSKLQSMHAFTISSWDSFHHKFYPQLLIIRDTIAASWNITLATIYRQSKSIYSATVNSDWIQDPALHEAIDFVKENRLEVFAWSTALLMLLYNLYRFFLGYYISQSRHQRDNHRASDGGDDEESNDKRSRNTSSADGNDYWDPPERVEDIIMEHMFQESVSAAANGNWPVVSPPVHTVGNRNKRHCTTRSRTNRHTQRHNIDPFQPIPLNVPRDTGISKEERRRHARINAREFAARDKQRLAAASPSPLKKTKAASPSPGAKNTIQSISNEERRRRARSNAREFAARDKQMLSESKSSKAFTTTSRSATSSSRGLSKKARLRQARTNAKRYAEQDRQRLEQAAADIPHKRNRNF